MCYWLVNVLHKLFVCLCCKVLEGYGQTEAVAGVNLNIVGDPSVGMFEVLQNVVGKPSVGMFVWGPLEYYSCLKCCETTLLSDISTDVLSER